MLQAYGGADISGADGAALGAECATAHDAYSHEMPHPDYGGVVGADLVARVSLPGVDDANMANPSNPNLQEGTGTVRFYAPNTPNTPNTPIRPTDTALFVRSSSCVFPTSRCTTG